MVYLVLSEIFVTLWATFWMQIVSGVSQEGCTQCAGGISVSDVYGML